MSDEERTCDLKVSDYYFRLTTESIRLFSNKTRSHCTFGAMVDDRASGAADLPTYYLSSDMLEHLSVIPTDGEVPLTFSILETSAASLDEAAKILEAALGTSVAFADALSLLMYDFIVEEAKTEVLTKLGLTTEQAIKYRKIMKRSPSNVIPIR